MSKQRTRRDFLKVTTAGIAGAAVIEALPASAKAVINSKRPSGEINVRLTAGAKRYSQEAPVRWRPASGGSKSAIQLDAAKTYQDMLGFGAAFTDAACYMFNQLAPADREKLLREFYDPAEMNFGVGRLCIGSSDYATKAYSYCDEADPELKSFSVDHDKEYILPALRMARKFNPELYLLGSPWSPPGWMKSNGSMLGGSMKKKFYQPYAQYFVKFLKAYEAEGVPVNSITTQNEVDTDQDGRMPACLWGQEYEIEFVGQHLGPALEKAGINTKIWLIDHNYNLWGRAICELEDKLVNKYAEGVAWHGYAGSPEAMSKVHNAFPTKSTYWTEGGPDYTDPAYLTDWTKWSAQFTGILRNWSRCIIGWNLALDEKGRPNIGPFPCGGVVTINSETKEITRSGQYWALAHYSKAVKRGAKRFDSKGEVANISHVAFVNPDGSKAVVLTNAGAETTTRVQMAGMAADVVLPKESVVTLMWK
ncbi:MAG TPA: glycoside hydrolase family 30 protein [Terriglobales bacterium]|nr:glycoside hydrolase family 30 protein [Terriglobales bacterium]